MPCVEETAGSPLVPWHHCRKVMEVWCCSSSGQGSAKPVLPRDLLLSCSMWWEQSKSWWSVLLKNRQGRRWSARGSGTTPCGLGTQTLWHCSISQAELGRAGHVGVMHSWRNPSPESLQKCRMKHFRVSSTAACCPQSVLFHFGCVWGSLCRCEKHAECASPSYFIYS